MRHSSAAILKRVGLSYFPVGNSRVPPYFDPRYQCEMELLRLDADALNPRFESHLEQLIEQMCDARVIANELKIKPAAAATVVAATAVATKRHARASGRVA